MRWLIGGCLMLLGSVLNAQAQQVCDTQMRALSAAHTRFEIHPEGVVSDHTYLLMWTACVQGQVWQNGRCMGTPQAISLTQAQLLAEEINRKGDLFYDDWRVPNMRELASITELHCKNPRINLQVFSATPVDFHWTTTSGLAGPDESRAFALSFGPEGYELRPESETHFVRWVRSGD